MKKIKILMSKCLYGDNVKYDGGNNYKPEILSAFKDYELILMCPEVKGGLSIPRDPSEIVGDKVLSNKGKDVTKEYTTGASYYAELAKKENIHYAILKSRSPSCGVGKIYDGTFSHTVINGDGIATQALKQAGVEVYTEENYMELLNKLQKNEK